MGNHFTYHDLFQINYALNSAENWEMATVPISPKCLLNTSNFFLFSNSPLSEIKGKYWPKNGWLVSCFCFIFIFWPLALTDRVVQLFIFCIFDLNRLRWTVKVRMVNEFYQDACNKGFKQHKAECCYDSSAWCFFSWSLIFWYIV